MSKIRPGFRVTIPLPVIVLHGNDFFFGKVNMFGTISIKVNMFIGVCMAKWIGVLLYLAIWICYGDVCGNMDMKMYVKGIVIC